MFTKIFSIMVVIVALFSIAPLTYAGSEHNLSDFAWSENIGWISFNNLSDGGPVNYGVNVDSITGNLSGYAWSAHVGWISFYNQAGCPHGTCQPRLVGTTFSGWARALNYGNGWDGWISLNSNNGGGGASYGVTLSGNALQNYAWGSDVVGWIHYNPPFGGVLLNSSQCNNGVDDNDPEDTLIDMADPGCSSPSDNDETNFCTTNSQCPSQFRCTDSNICVPMTQCSDGIDNDGDGKIDWPNDPGCNDLFDNDEKDAAVTPTVDLKVRRSTTSGPGAMYSDGPIIVSAGSSVDLQWTTTNEPEACIMFGLWTGNQENLGYPAPSMESRTVTESGVYTLSCTNAAQGEGRNSVRVIVNKIIEF